MYVIYLRLSMQTDQTNLPLIQLTSLKVKNLHELNIFQGNLMEPTKVNRPNRTLPFEVSSEVMDESNKRRLTNRT